MPPANRKPPAAAKGSNPLAPLGRKLGPLPVWAWTALIVGVYWLFFRRVGTASESTAVPVTSTASGADSGAQQPAGGDGGAASSLNADLLGQLYSANAATIDSLTNAIVTQRAIDAAPVDQGAPPGASSQAGVASTPTTIQVAPATAPPVVSPNPSKTQTAAGVLRWGGMTFSTKAAFDKWARSHGTTTAKELAGHPQAATVYRTLR